MSFFPGVVVVLNILLMLTDNNKTKLYDKHTFLQTLFHVHAPQRSPQRAKPPDRYIRRRDFSSN